MSVPAVPVQLSFDQLDTPLRETTFVVVDLETTGARPGHDAITEIGAVKIRGGEILGELATLVDPGRSIPPHIVEITGITTAMVVDAPPIDRVLPSFLEFAEGAVLVAHNAPFDTGFLKAAAAATGTPWPRFRVLCTVKLARRVLSRDEAPSVKLSNLARLFDVGTTPTHRALDDARATVDVLHGLIERVGNLGVHSLTELTDYLPNVTAHQRAKRILANDLPRAPGVYLFRGPSDEVLYVGTATDLRRRVRNYFTGSETRGRMKEMVALATRVDHVECSHALEASIRELTLIAAHTPPYNRRSKYPKRAWWISMTSEAFPRLSVVRTPTANCLGPFRTRADAAEVADAVAEHCGIRTCTASLRIDEMHGPRCRSREIAPCPAMLDGPCTADDYAHVVAGVYDLFAGRSDEPLHRMRRRTVELADAELFENAAHVRDRAVALILALGKLQRLSAVCALDELVLARHSSEGGWDFAVVRAGRLASAGTARQGVAPMPVVAGLVRSAATVSPDASPLRGASPEEVALIARWIESEGVRIVSSSDGYAEPVRGAGSWGPWCELATAESRVDTARAHYEAST